jgi:hypothetical protein
MQGDQPISWLMFFTLAAGIVIVGFVFINFIKSRSNRAVAADTLEGSGHGRGMAPDGAAPELIGLTVFALLAMALLATGVSNSSDRQTAQVPGPSEPATTGAAPGARSDPKTVAPKPGVAPTASDAGVGNSPGSTGTLTK